MLVLQLREKRTTNLLKKVVLFFSAIGKVDSSLLHGSTQWDIKVKILHAEYCFAALFVASS